MFSSPTSSSALLTAVALTSLLQPTGGGDEPKFRGMSLSLSCISSPSYTYHFSSLPICQKLVTHPHLPGKRAGGYVATSQSPPLRSPQYLHIPFSSFAEYTYPYSTGDGLRSYPATAPSLKSKIPGQSAAFPTRSGCVS